MSPDWTWGCNLSGKPSCPGLSVKGDGSALQEELHQAIYWLCVDTWESKGGGNPWIPDVTPQGQPDADHLAADAGNSYISTTVMLHSLCLGNYLLVIIIINGGN